MDPEVYLHGVEVMESFARLAFAGTFFRMGRQLMANLEPRSIY